MSDIESSGEHTSHEHQDVSLQFTNPEAHKMFYDEISPSLEELTLEEREKFDAQLVAYFTKKGDHAQRQTAEAVLEGLTLDELTQVAMTVEGFLARKSFRELGIIPPSYDL